MKRFAGSLVPAILALFAVAGPARATTGIVTSYNCTSLAGQVSNYVFTPQVDIYDGAINIGAPFIPYTPPTSQFSYVFPDSIKDNQPHTISVKFRDTNLDLTGSPFTLQCAGTPPGYRYYYTSPLTSVDAAAWYQNGVVTAAGTGLTIPDSTGGSLISKIAVPDGTGDYEINTTLALKATGGT